MSREISPEDPVGLVIQELGRETLESFALVDETLAPEDACGFGIASMVIDTVNALDATVGTEAALEWQTAFLEYLAAANEEIGVRIKVSVARKEG